jgi:hypothetical protein
MNPSNFKVDKSDATISTEERFIVKNYVQFYKEVETKNQ